MREWMFRLVEPDPSATRQLDLGNASPPGLIEWALEGNPFSFQFRGGRLDVLTQEIELVTLLLLGGMERDLGGRKGEDQPTATRIYRVETEHVFEEAAVGLGVPAVDDHVRAGDERLHPLSLSSVRSRSSGPSRELSATFSVMQ